MIKPFISAILLAAASAISTPALAGHHACEADPVIGQFDTGSDLLISNFDSKPDVDDLQAIAAFGTVLSDPDMACVNYVATMGAYGVQRGEFIASAKLFDLAFGDNWVDAHNDREAAVAALAAKALPVLEAGGKVWITEAGQSDVSAALVRSLPRALWGQIHIVQHSEWNENTTTKADFNFVRTKTRYHRISDGNYSLNGTPNFKTVDQQYWPAFLGHERVGALWQEAKTLSEHYNPLSTYLNPAVDAGGMDFSDTVELAYVFGFVDMVDTGDFVARFIASE